LRNAETARSAMYRSTITDGDQGFDMTVAVPQEIAS
jgi:hypothetical protein